MTEGLDYPIRSTSREAFLSRQGWGQPPVKLPQPGENLAARPLRACPADPGEDHGTHEFTAEQIDYVSSECPQLSFEHEQVSDSDSPRASADDYRAVFGAVSEVVEVVTDYLAGAHWTLTSKYIEFICKILKDFERVIRDNMEPIIRNREALEEFFSGPNEKPQEKVVGRLDGSDETVKEFSDTADPDPYAENRLREDWSLESIDDQQPGEMPYHICEPSGEDLVSCPGNDTSHERDSQ